ncbi:DUF3293 domain-containing protein [Rhodocyclus gracilis]|uniref:DUF3293 domain-containing protein n=1 Tax=Rhodocyclus tenuis TaxID=1066 RepID=A0A6L5JSH7_RHOTE|nr:DUF3293 domain-containing protein [Rhodocyclus gracilis]
MGNGGSPDYFDLRIDGVNRAFVTWCRTMGVTYWAILTAHNPQGRLRSPQQNAAADAALAARLRSTGWRLARSVALADAGDWPPEPGFFVLDAPCDAMCGLAREFAQAAVVVGGRLPLAAAGVAGDGAVAQSCDGAKAKAEMAPIVDSPPRLLWLVADSPPPQARP